MKEINPDLANKSDQIIGQQPSNSKFGVFLAEFGRLKRIVAGFGLGASEGEDILQDVLIKALVRSGKNRTHKEYIRWLTKVTVNRCLTEHRRRRSFRRNARKILLRRTENDVDSIRADEKMILTEELEIVRQSLKQLEDSLLGLVILRYFCDFNSTEVAEIMGLNSSTVRSRLREARIKLARQLLERGVGP